MRPLLVSLLLALGVTTCAASVIDRQNWRHYDNLENIRVRRDANDDDLHSWLTNDQKEELKTLKSAGDMVAYKDKVMELYGKLPAAEKEKWNVVYKDMCVQWIKKVATEAEHAELKTLYEEKKFAEVEEKVTELRKRLSDEESKEVGLWEDGCRQMWIPKKVRRSVDSALEKHLSWLSAEQKAEIRKMHSEGKSQSEIKSKLFEFINGLEGEQKSQVKENTQKECYKWMESVATKEEIEALHKLHHVDHAACKKRVREFIDRLGAEEKKKVESNLEFCEKVWYGDHGSHANNEGHHGHHHKRRHTLDEALNDWLTWLTEDQRKEIVSTYETDKKAVYEKVLGYFEAATGETKETATKQLKGACRHMISEAIGDENSAAVKALKDTGATKEAIGAKVEEFVNAITDEKEKAQIQHILGGCKKVYQVARKRRDHHTLDEALEKYLSWLNDDQKKTLKDLYAAGNKDEMYKKILEYFNSAEGETKAAAATQLKGACRHFISDAIGEEKAAQIKSMKEAGTSDEEIGAKVKEFVEAIIDDATKARATKMFEGCKVVYKAAARKRRDHDHHTLDESIEKYLSWLNDDQKKTLKDLYAAGNKDEMYKKILEYFTAAEGETKAVAATKLKSACRHFITDAIGEEKAAQIKTMKEGGSSEDEIGAKVKEFVDALADGATKTRASKMLEGCKVVYKAAARKRRDHHTLDEALEKYLSWLNDDQKKTLKDLYAAGNKDEMYKKILEYFNTAEGETKAVAATQLKGACRHFITDAIGEEKAAEIKTMKEGEKSDEEIGAKVKEFVDAIEDGATKTRATKMFEGCKVVYKAAARKRRDHHTLDEALEKYLSWLNDDQKKTLKDLYSAGNKDELYKKILEYFNSAEGETKATAATQLKGACRHFLTDAIGADNAGQIKTLKDGGATDEEIGAKVKDMIDGITEDATKARALRMFNGCKLVYKSARLRRDHHDHKHTIDELLEKFLSWLSDDQKKTIKDLYAAGQKEEVYKQIHAFYDKTSGDVKVKAQADLQGACKHFIGDAIGAENAATVKALRDSGATVDEVAAKISELIAGIADEETKARATRTLNSCKPIFKTAKRFRRDHKHTLEEALKQFLTWLDEPQKAKLKELYAAGNKKEVYEKVMEFYEAATGETRQKATGELKSACKHFIGDMIGAEKTAQITAFKEAGATNDEIGDKVSQFVNEIEDEEKKAKAKGAVAACKKVFAAARKRRDHKHNVEEAMEKFLTWLSAEEKEEVKTIHAKGDRKATYGKVVEYFEAATGEKKDKAAQELKHACKHYMKDLIGEDGAAEVKKLKEQGADNQAISKRVEELIAGISDEEQRQRAIDASVVCRKVYDV